MSFNHKNRLNRSTVLILSWIAIFSVGIYLLTSWRYFRIGFPLDDAWIHQTFARNLALHGEWVFLPGKSAGGSTAPLWSTLLAIGYCLRLAPYAWAYLLGAICLWLLAFLTETVVRSLVLSYRPRFPWAGTCLLLEWHLVWAAGSGMETLLFAVLVTVVLIRLVFGNHRPFGLGLLIGLSIWVRPDGITLLCPAVLVVFLSQTVWLKRLRALVDLGLGFGSLFALYLVFNLVVAGLPWPTTFYAKQAEYAVLLQIPFWKRYGLEVLQLLSGVGVVLFPGFLLMFISAIRKRSWEALAGMAWLFGYLGLYAWRLPVTFQHGRYVIPAMPTFFIFGLIGLIGFIQKNSPRWRWAVSVFWKSTAMIVLFLFWGLGARAYAQNVAYIESEMVKTARWVSANVAPAALVAAHDIGALGYFGRHDLVDLAGLVSPEVIPIIRDQIQLAAFLDKRGVDYLVTFPDWYPYLISGLSPVFTTGSPYALAMGGQNMTVYRWRQP